jgi:CHAT domain-containing protein
VRVSARSSLSVILALAATLSLQAMVFAQNVPITAANDGTGTLVNQSGNTFNITGGTTSSSGANLFQSFSNFGLNAGQIANFQSNATIQNILSRVTGGNFSSIDGLIKVTGSNANLFLLNPAGIIFGPNASLNVPASFTATTANAVGFGSEWFNASGSNNYTALNGSPTSLALSMGQPGSIINGGVLSVGPGQQLSLIGGTVISTGTLSGGQVNVAAVPGEHYVRLGQPGNVLSIDVPVSGGNLPTNWNLPILSLPELLAGGSNSQLMVDSAGAVRLGSSSLVIGSGDVAVRSLNAEAAQISASSNLTLLESQLRTSKDLVLEAGNTITIRDSVNSPILIQSGGNLTIQGDQNIDILALSHPATPFQSGGRLVLSSDGIVSGDAHFSSNGTFSIQTLNGKPGTFVSKYDPIISSNSNVSFGDYRGVSLKVETQGSISGGNIIITGNESAGNLSTANPNDPDIQLLINSSALILRAGVTPLNIVSFGNIVNLSPGGNATISGTTFNASNTTTNPATITIGNVTNSLVILAAPGNITTARIIGEGQIDITSGNGSIVTGALSTGANTNNVSLQANNGTISTGFIDTSLTPEVGDPSGNGGNVLVTAGSNVTIDGVNTGSFSRNGNSGNAGNITIASSTGNIVVTNSLIANTDATIEATIPPNALLTAGNGGNINLNASLGNIDIGTVSATAFSGNNLTGRGGDVLLTAPAGNVTLNVPIISLAAINTDSLINTGTNFGSAGNVTITAGNRTNLNGNITASALDTNRSITGGTVVLNGNVSVASGNIAVDTSGSGGGNSTGTAVGGNIVFNSGIDGAATGANLILSAGSGNITLNGVAGNTLPLNNLTLNSTGTTNLNNALNIGSLTTDAGGTTRLNGNITSSIDQTYNDAVFLDQSLTLRGTAGNIAFNGSVTTAAGVDATVDSANQLVINQNFTSSSGSVLLSSAFFATGNAGNINVSTSNLTIATNAFNVGATIAGSGTLTIRPLSPSTSIGIAGAAGTLQVTNGTLSLLQNGFASITFGSPNQTGNIAIGAVTFQDPIIFQTPGSSVSVNGTLRGIDNASFNFISSNATTILSANVTTAGAPITFGNNVQLAPTEVQTITVSTDGGNVSTGATINFAQNINGTSFGNQSLVVNAGTSAALFGGLIGSTVPLNNLTISSGAALTQAGAWNIRGNTSLAVGTANNITLGAANDFNSVFISTGNNAALTDINNLALGNITLGGNLTVNAGGVISQAIIASTVPIPTRIVVAGNAAFTTTLGNIGNVAVTNSTATVIGNSVIGGDFILNSTGNSSQAPGTTLAVAGNLNITSGGTNTLTNNTVGNVTLANGDVIINQVGLITLAPTAFTGNVTVNSLASGQQFNGVFGGTAIALNSTANSFGGTLSLNTANAGISNVTATPGITQSGALSVPGLATFNATQVGNITLLSPTNSFNSLAFLGNAVSITQQNAIALLASSATGNVILQSGNGAISQTGALTVGGTSQFTGTTIALGNTTNLLADAVSLNSTENATLVNNSATVLSTSAVGGDLNVTANGNLTQAGILTVSGTANLSAGTNTFTENAGFVGGSLSIQAGATNLNAPISGNNTTITNSGLLTIASTATISATGNFIQNGTGNVSTAGNLAAGNVQFNSPVFLTGAQSITANNGQVSFASSVDGGQDLTISANTLTISGTVGATTPLSNLTIAIANAITQTAPWRVIGTTALNAGTSDILLGNAANDFGTVSIASANNVTLADLNALNFGNVNVNSNLSTTAGTITQTLGSGFTVVGNASFTTTQANTGNVAFTNSSNTGTALGNSVIGGDFSLTSAGNVSQVPGSTLQVAGNVSVTAQGKATLTNPGNLLAETTFANGDVIINQVGPIILPSRVVNGNFTVNSLASGQQFNSVFTGSAIQLTNATNRVGGTLSLNTANTGIGLVTGTPEITQSGIQSVSGLAFFNASSEGNINVSTSTNQFGSLGFTGNNVSLGQQNPVVLVASSAVGNLVLLSESSIAQTGPLSIAGTSTIGGGAVVLTNPENFFTGSIALGSLTDATLFNNTDTQLSLAAVQGNLSVTSAGNLAIPVGGNLSITSGGLLFQDGEVVVNGTLLLNAGANTVAVAGNITSGNLSIVGAAINLNAPLQTRIGDAIFSNSGLLTIASTAPLNIAGSFQQNGTGSVNTAGSITASSIQFNSPVFLSGSESFTATNGSVTLNSTIDGLQDLSVTASNISFLGAVGSSTALGNLNVNGTGTTVFNNTVNAGNLTTDAAGSTRLAGNVATGGNQTYGDGVILGNSIILSGNNITFNSSLNGNARNTSLTVNAVNPTFNGAVGNVVALGNLNVNGSRTTVFNNTVNAGNLTTDAAGSTLIAGNISTSGNQSYGDIVTLGSSVTLTGENITFGQTLDSNGTPQNFTGNAGNLTFNGAVGGTSPLGDLTLTSSGSTTFFSTVNATNLIANGTAQLFNNVTTSGNQIFNGSLLLLNPLLLSSGKNITFNATVGTGDTPVSLNATAANAIAINNSVNVNGVNLTAASLSSSATGAVNAGLGNSALVADSIAFAAPVTGSGFLTIQPRDSASSIGIAGADGTLQLSTATIEQFTNGFQGITIGSPNQSGNITVNTVTFLDPITLQTPSGSLFVNGQVNGLDNASIDLISSDNTTVLNADIITAGNPIFFRDSVRLGTSVLLNTTNGGNATQVGNITFFKTLDATNAGVQGLTLRTGSGDQIFTGAVGAQQALGNLTIANAANVTFSSSLQAGNILQSSGSSLTSFNGSVNANSLNLTGTGFAFNAPVTTGGDMIVANSGSLRINSSSALSVGGAFAQTGNGVTDLSGNISTVNSGISFNGPALVSAPSTLSTNNGDVFFGNTLNGNNLVPLTPIGSPIPGVIPNSSLTILAGRGNVTFSNTVGVSSNSTTGINVPISTFGGSLTSLQVSSANLKASDVNAGLISFTATGNISAGNLTTGGGNINLSAAKISTGALDSSVLSPATGNAGNVTLSGNQILVSTINAQSANGRGGTVDVTSQTTFQAVGSFNDLNNRQVSISTASSGGGGAPITIRHLGGVFTVGNAATNGTTASISSRATNSIDPVRSFPGSFTQNDIRIITTDQNIVAIPTPEKIPTPTPTSPISLGTIDAGDVLPKPGNIEQSRTAEFVNYFGPSLPENKLSTTEIQSILRKLARETGKKPAILYVDAFAKRTELVLVTPDGEPILRIVPDAPREAVLAKVREFRNEVLAPNKRNSNSFLAASRQLYQWLITPVEGDLREQKIDTVVFSLDRGLRHVPLAALNDGKQYLVEKYGISLIPSINLVDTRFGDVKKAQVLAMGASSFDDDNPLPAVPLELSAVVKEVGGGRFFLNKEFTLANLKSQRIEKPFGIIHLATHADFNPGPASASFIKLSDTRLGLDRRELQALRWNDPPVELLVLSACRTAIGDENAELGFAGLAVGAGVKTAIASLWYASDEGTLALMTGFYEQLKNAPIKAEALRTAQIDMILGRVRIEKGQLITPQLTTTLPDELKNIGNVVLTHPYYWSGFTMIGSPW